MLIKKLQDPSSAPVKIKVTVTILEESQDGPELDATSGAPFPYLLKSGR
jgi:hypothetical protein